ncbi:MAG: C69 family dipeptidase, partial [Bacilli bacterium]|nr:C69 family dipeptidase [Bacilli bacterium]
MPKKWIALFCVVLLLIPVAASACTSIVVGREVSADGSFIFGRTDDTHTIGEEQIVTIPAQTSDSP